MVSFGMPTLLEFSTLQQNIDLCVELKLNFIEINMCFPYLSSKALHKIDLNEFASKNNIYFNFHLPEEIDFGFFNEEMRIASIQLVENILKRQDKKVIKLLNMHLNKGTYVTLPNEKVYLYEEEYDIYTENVIKAVEYLSPELVANNIILCFENTENFSNIKTQMLLKKLLNYKNIGITWDFGHDASAMYSDKPFILNNITALKHTHLHDFNKQTGNNHQELYSGNLDIQESLKIIMDNNLSCVIETKNTKTLTNSVKKLFCNLGC